MQYEMALNSVRNIETFEEGGLYSTASKGHQSAGKVDRNKIEQIADYCFERKTTYERTREKLIGLTIPYSIPITESFEGIIAKYITEESVKELLALHKEEIIDLFERNQHRNLRTLISACIAIFV